MKNKKKRYMIDARKLEPLGWKLNRYNVLPLDGDNDDLFGWLCTGCGVKGKQVLLIKHSKKCKYQRVMAANALLFEALRGRGK